MYKILYFKRTIIIVPREDAGGLKSRIRPSYPQRVVELIFSVTCNNISVIYVTAQMCRRTEEEIPVPTVGLPPP